MSQRVPAHPHPHPQLQERSLSEMILEALKVIEEERRAAHDASAGEGDATRDLPGKHG